MDISAVIPALRKDADIPFLKDSRSNTVFLMYGNLSTLEDTVRKIKSCGKKVFLHTDLIKGLSQDRDAMKYIAETLNPEGIVTTKTHIIRQAKSFGLQTIHHLFLIDTNAFESGIRNVKASCPDAVEIMPGLMPGVISDFASKIEIPLLVGGLVKTIRDMENLWNAGAHSVITGSPELWNLSQTYPRAV